MAGGDDRYGSGLLGVTSNNKIHYIPLRAMMFHLGNLTIMTLCYPCCFEHDLASVIKFK